MLLKRHYEPAALKKWLKARDAELKPQIDGIVETTSLTEAAARKLLNNRYADANDPPKISHIEVKRVGDKQNLSPGFIDRGIAECWLSIGNGKITIKTVDGEPDLVFDIKRVPGHYSCFTGEKLNGEDDAKAHVKAQKDDSPDPEHPSGYRQNLYYECVRESDRG